MATFLTLLVLAAGSANSIVHGQLPPLLIHMVSCLPSTIFSGPFAPSEEGGVISHSPAISRNLPLEFSSANAVTGIADSTSSAAKSKLAARFQKNFFILSFLLFCESYIIYCNNIRGIVQVFWEGDFCIFKVCLNCCAE